MKAIFTVQMLIDAKACSQQVNLFRKLFGESVNVTVSRARKVAGKFDWGFARRFLDGEGRASYDAALAPARATRDATVATARASYDATVATALASYDATVATARASYDATVTTALASYDVALATAWASYDATVTTAWAKAYIATCARREAAQVAA